MSLATTSPNLILPPSAQAQILTEAAKGSAFAKVARKIDIPGTGTVIHTVGVADFGVVAEGAEKPVKEGLASSKLVRAHTFAGVFPVTRQLTKDATALYNAILAQAPEGLARSFDNAVLGNLGNFADFDNFGGVQTASITDYKSLLAAFKKAKRFTHLVATEDFRWTLANITDPAGRPVFDPNANLVFGRPIVFTEAAGDFAIAADFSRSVWGDVEGIEYLVSQEATIPDPSGTGEINLFMTNQVAVRIEARYGFRGDLTNAVKLVPGVAA
jgi:HK97 family phage major capsid protein